MKVSGSREWKRETGQAHLGFSTWGRASEEDEGLWTDHPVLQDMWPIKAYSHLLSCFFCRNKMREDPVPSTETQST